MQRRNESPGGTGWVGVRETGLRAVASSQTSSSLAGGWAEQRALRLLRQRGWTLLERNWHCRWGEIDLLLSKPERLLLVEVKGRPSTARARSLERWTRRSISTFSALAVIRRHRPFTASSQISIGASWVKSKARKVVGISTWLTRRIADAGEEQISNKNEEFFL